MWDTVTRLCCMSADQSCHAWWTCGLGSPGASSGGGTEGFPQLTEYCFGCGPYWPSMEGWGDSYLYPGWRFGGLLGFNASATARVISRR